MSRMRFTVEPREGYLRAEMRYRESAEETKQFVEAIVEAIGRHRLGRVLIVIRESQAVFRVGRYNLFEAFRAALEIVPDLRVAHVSDSPELRASQDYIALLARQHGIAAKAFPDEEEALEWLLAEG